MLRRLAVLIALLAGALALPAGASAAAFPIFGGFHSVLAFGEGQSTSAQDLAAFTAAGTVPSADVNQAPLYEGLEQAWPGFTTADLGRFYKDSSFAAPPAPSTLSGLLGQLGPTVTGAPAGTEEPRAGVLVQRTSDYQVPRIYGTTRADAMWGAGYVTAEDRLFLMDVLRHTAQGTLTELLGSSATAGDSAQLGIANQTPQQLTAQMQSLPTTMGAEGAQALSDINDYVAGINAFIGMTRVDPALLPAEYPALGIVPQDWTLADSAAVGTYLIGQFTVFGGPQPQQAEALRMAMAKLGRRRGTQVYNDLRLAADPSAVVTLARRYRSDATGRVNPASQALIDPGSLVARDAQTGGPVKPAAAARAVGPAGRPLPGWARRLAATGLQLPHMESNAVLVDARRSGTGQALAVMGPQVGYYTPEIFLEYELHAPGIDESGVSFPGSSPYILIGHGIDFAWTGTSAYSANEDVFAEKLCDPDGSAPSFASSHYLYRGRCVAFAAHDVTETTPIAPTSPSAPGPPVVLHALSSVHGPIASFATVHGTPVALAISAATRGHEAQSYVAFMRLAENVPTSPQSFVAAMRPYTGSENWFYVDHRDIAVLQSGWFPRHARGTDPDLPIWGTGRWDWQGFRAADDSYRRLPPGANPTAIDPPSGILVNWNNAIAHGWRVAAGDWESGPVVRATILQDLLGRALHRGALDLAGITGAVTAPSLTADVRGLAVWPWLRRVIGRSRDARVRALTAMLDGWAAAGSQRRSTQTPNVVDDSPAVLLMDTWWPLLVRREFQPVLGGPLMDLINKDFNTIVPDGLRDGSGNGFFAGWSMDVQKDLRQVLHRRVSGRFSRTYCGHGSLTACRAMLQRTLRQAAAQLTARYGPTGKWILPVTCPQTTPAGCDQIVPTSAGAISVAPQPFDNRGTFYQAIAVDGHR
ncbi:MAG TPA: penicillin acylase family protein [Solirubrobacteraceae bacterium]|nr:penicillin acylase family protein [Solirubrobacteraceae bacterium]